MRISNPIVALATSLVKARDYDLPEVVSEWQGKKHVHRPNEDQLTIRLFDQEWPNTYAGMDARGGLAGQAFCSTWTVVVLHSRAACVYFSGNLAYRVAKIGDTFISDMKNCTMVGQRSAVERYKAVLP